MSPRPKKARGGARRPHESLSFSRCLPFQRQACALASKDATAPPYSRHQEGSSIFQRGSSPLTAVTMATTPDLAATQLELQRTALVKRSITSHSKRDCELLDIEEGGETVGNGTIAPVKKSPLSTRIYELRGMMHDRSTRLSSYRHAAQCSIDNECSTVCDDNVDNEEAALEAQEVTALEQHWSQHNASGTRHGAPVGTSR